MPKKLKMPIFKVSKKDAHIITEIAERAGQMLGSTDKTSTIIDICACHKNGCPLNLEKLLDAEHQDFLHDIHGINQHIDRRTGNIMDHFLPRCAMPDKKSIGTQEKRRKGNTVPCSKTS